MGLASIVFALAMGSSNPLYHELVDVARLAKQCGEHKVYETVHHRYKLNSPDIKLDYFDRSGDVGPSDHKIGEGDMISLNTPKEAIE